MCKNLSPNPHFSFPPLANNKSIDINILRERSKHLDLPLISALCNDRSLLKQTKAFGHPQNGQMAFSPEFAKLRAKHATQALANAYLNKPQRTSIIHRHPNDKLPPIPTQTAKGNNYVMDPTPTTVKHKSFNSQPNL